MNLSPMNSLDPSVPRFHPNLSGDLNDRMQTSSHSVPANQGNNASSAVDLSKIEAILKDEGGIEEDLKPKAKVVSKLQLSVSNESDKSLVKKRRPRKKWKKPKDKPNRPLSAYNLFFQQQRAAMLGAMNDTSNADKEEGLEAGNSAGESDSDNGNNAEDSSCSKPRVHRKAHGKPGFAEMARSIGAKWKTLPDSEKKVFEQQAAKEKTRYASELAIWKEQQKLKEKEQREHAALAKINQAKAAEAGNFAVDASRNSMIGNITNLHRFQDPTAGQEFPTMGYLRTMQGRQNSGEGEGINSYPHAAEASANAILQQYQGMLTQNSVPPQFNQFLLTQGQGLNSNSTMSLAEQLQMNSIAQRQMQLERLQMQQLLLQNRLAMQNSIQQQQQQQQQNFNAQPTADMQQPKTSQLQAKQSGDLMKLGYPSQHQQRH